MDKFSGYGEQTVANPADTTLTLTGNVNTRGKVYDIMWGAINAPADNSLKTTVKRCTAIGTGTGFTPVKLDEDSPAAQLVCTVNHTAEPTYTANNELMVLGVNQRAVFRWVAAPGGEIVIPATANSGIGIFTEDVAAAATPNVNATVHWEE